MSNILGMFNGADIEAVSALIDKLEASSFDYLKLENDEICITIGKNGAGEVTAAPVAAPVATVAPAAVAAPVVEAISGQELAAPVVAADAVIEADGVTIVRSESYGIYYAQSEPGVPPYVTVGKKVTKGDTLCLVEIMKTFNAVSAPMDGEIVGIHVKNEEMLEPGQPLVSIKTL